MWGRTCSSLLQSQIFYVYRPRPHVFRGSAEEAPGKRFGTGGGSIQWVVVNRISRESFGRESFGRFFER